MNKEFFSHDFDDNSKVSLGFEDGKLELEISTKLAPLLVSAKKRAGDSTFGKIASGAIDLIANYLELDLGNEAPKV